MLYGFQYSVFGFTKDMHIHIGYSKSLGRYFHLVTAEFHFLQNFRSFVENRFGKEGVLCEVINRLVSASIFDSNSSGFLWYGGNFFVVQSHL